MAELLVLVVAGALGGLLLGGTSRASHKLRLPFVDTLVELGFVGDALLGGGASLALFLFTAPLLDLRGGESPMTEDWPKLAALGILSGAAGVKYVVRSRDHLNERLAALDDRVGQLERVERAADLINQGESLAAEHRPEEGLAAIEEALRVVPQHEAALLAKAKILFDRCKWDEAVETLGRLIRVNPSSDRAHYALASYKAACGKYSKDDVLQGLKSAITLNPRYKEHAARFDHRFDGLREDADFRSLVGAS